MSKMFRWMLISCVLGLMMSLSLTLAPTRAASNGSQFFTPTGYAVSGKFLEYWTNHGGLATFGYPITGTYYEFDPVSGQNYLVQWFERNRFELHPEYAGTPYEVLLGLLGRQVTASRSDETAFRPLPIQPSNSNQHYFSQTGHTLSDAFLTRWETTGGLSLYGYPISQPFMEVNPSDGQIYQVQYFERNRFELHPQNPAPYNILLGLLGQQFKQVPLSPELNNRATPLVLVNSLYNALNLQDYQRAYNYWLSPSGEQKNPRSLVDFSKGYEQTASVGVATGEIVSNGTAGTVYYAVPTVIIADQKDGSQQRYYGCYQIARIDAQIGDKPLPNPLYISFGKFTLATSNNDETNLLKQAQQLVSSQNLCAY